MMEFINLGQIQYLNKYRINLSHFKFLDLAVGEAKLPNVKWVKDLEKAGMIYNGEITEFGRSVYEETLAITSDKITSKKERPQNKDFEEWWENFPAFASFTINGNVFESTRSLRVEKSSSRKLYEEIIKEGKYSPQQLLLAVNREVDVRKRESVRLNKNEMNYMKGTKSYLNSRQFEAFLNKTEEKKMINVGI